MKRETGDGASAMAASRVAGTITGRSSSKEVDRSLGSVDESEEFHSL